MRCSAILRTTSTSEKKSKIKRNSNNKHGHFCHEKDMTAHGICFDFNTGPSKVIREKSRGEGSLIEQDTIENVSEPKFFF